MPVYIPPLRNFGATVGVSGDYVTTTGEEQIVFGEKTWVNDQAFLNNIYIEGTLSGDSSQLKIADNIVILNEGETFDGVALGESGFIVDRGIGDNSYILFKENTVGVVHDNRWVIDIGDGSEEIILYNNIPDDITFNGKVTVNNDLDVNFDLTLLSLNNNEGAILIVDIDGKVELASVTINDITGALLDLQEQIDDIEVGAGGFTPIAGDGITITPTGDDYIFSVDDYISRTEVLTISGQIQTDVVDIVFDVNELQQRVDIIESDYLTSADISGFGFIPLEGEGITITPSGSDYIFAVADYISASEVFDIRDDLNYDISFLELEIADVSGSLQGQIDNIDVGVTEINSIAGSVTIIGGEGVELTQSLSNITLSISDEYVTTQDISGFASKNELDDYILKSGDAMTGPLSITVPEGDTALEINDVKFSSVTMSNVDVNTIIDEFPITEGNSCFLDLLITNGTDFRASRVISVWNNDGTFIKFNEISSESIGDTSDIDINVSIYNSTDIRIKAQPSSGTWNIKMSKKIL